MSLLIRKIIGSDSPEVPTTTLKTLLQWYLFLLLLAADGQDLLDKVTGTLGGPADLDQLLGGIVVLAEFEFGQVAVAAVKAVSEQDVARSKGFPQSMEELAFTVFEFSHSPIEHGTAMEAKDNLPFEDGKTAALFLTNGLRPTSLIGGRVRHGQG